MPDPNPNPVPAPNPTPNSAAPPRPIRIVHCIGAMTLGGAEGQLAELIARLPRDRFEQTLILLQGGGPLLDRVRASGCRVVELNYVQHYRWFDPRGYAAMGNMLGRFVRELRDFRPHILHAQLFWSNIFGVAAGRLAGVPALVTSRLQLRDYKAGRPWMQRLENLANRATTAVFANSAAVRADMLATDRIDPKIIKIIYNGVVLERFAHPDPARVRAEFGLAPDDLLIVAVANLHPYKGHADLLAAVAGLKAKYPGLRLLLPGRDQGARAALESLIGELGLAGAIHLPGERKDIPDLLAAADIVVHPSHQEGFSNSVLEGMASARPMVVTNVGGNPEAVRDGEDGFVVPPKDPAALATALDRLLADAALRQQMGAAARRRIEQEFSMDVMIERFAAWYEELASLKRD